jgi:hypothetical protein
MRVVLFGVHSGGAGDRVSAQRGTYDDSDVTAPPSQGQGFLDPRSGDEDC